MMGHTKHQRSQSPTKSDNRAANQETPEPPDTEKSFAPTRYREVVLTATHYD